MKKVTYYNKTFHPNVPKDVEVLNRIVKEAYHYSDGSALFNYMPLSDKNTWGKRNRCPDGEDIYTPAGWNMLKDAHKLFLAGESITFSANNYEKCRRIS